MYTGLVEELGSFAGKDGERYRFNAALVLTDAAEFWRGHIVEARSIGPDVRITVLR